jgi:hypothetical protein
MAFATVEDVEVRLMRTLDESEAKYCLVLLDEAQRRLNARIPSLTLEAVESEAYRDQVVAVTAQMVVRVLRNPDGVIQQNLGETGYQINWRVASGMLTVSDEEWESLGYRKDVRAVLPETDAYVRGRNAVTFRWDG